MLPGEGHANLLREIVRDQKYSELSAKDVSAKKFPGDGTYLVRELPANVLSNQPLHTITFRAGEYQKFEKWLEARCMSYYLQAGMLHWNDYQRTNLFLDLVRIEVKDNEIVDFKVIEVDGEQHFSPVKFSRYSKTEGCFSDTVIGDYMRDALFPGKVVHIDATTNPCRLSEYILKAINS